MKEAPIFSFHTWSLPIFLSIYLQLKKYSTSENSCVEENERHQPKTLRFFPIIYWGLLLVDGLHTDFKAEYQTCPEIK